MQSSYQLLGSIDELPTDLVVEGYYWLSNSHKPIIVDGQPIQSAWFRQLPFVVEANFYAKDEGISYHVKNIDGNYLVGQFNLKPQPANCVLKKYLLDETANRKYLMAEVWQEISDDNLEGMTTLVPAWSAFMGFQNSSNDKNRSNG